MKGCRDSHAKKYSGTSEESTFFDYYIDVIFMYYKVQASYVYE